jgi:hypothetical protein
MRRQIEELKQMGPLPVAKGADVALLRRYQQLLDSVAKPVSDEEARVLVGLFGPDDCFGLAWTVLHLVETAPGWPLADCLNGSNEWVETLRQRSVRGGRLPEPG